MKFGKTGEQLHSSQPKPRMLKKRKKKKNKQTITKQANTVAKYHFPLLGQTLGWLWDRLGQLADLANLHPADPPRALATAPALFPQGGCRHPASSRGVHDSTLFTQSTTLNYLKSAANLYLECKGLKGKEGTISALIYLPPGCMNLSQSDYLRPQ